MAWAIGIVIVLHVVAAYWHLYAKLDEGMARMWPPGGRVRPESEGRLATSAPL